VIGVGGGDVRPEHVAAIAADLSERSSAGTPILMEAGT
jgi:hypothetical protein